VAQRLLSKIERRGLVHRAIPLASSTPSKPAASRRPRPRHEGKLKYCDQSAGVCLRRPHIVKPHAIAMAAEKVTAMKYTRYSCQSVPL